MTQKRELSDIVPAARAACFARMTHEARVARFVGMTKYKENAGRSGMLLPAFLLSASSGYMWPTSDIFTIASVVKNARSTAPMLMYQHSRSGVSMPGR